METGNVHKLTGRAVGFRGIEDQPPLKIKDTRYYLGQLPDRNILARSDIDQWWRVFDQETIEMISSRFKRKMQASAKSSE